MFVFFQMEIMRLEKQFIETEKNDDLEKSTLIQSYKNRISVIIYIYLSIYLFINCFIYRI